MPDAPPEGPASATDQPPAADHALLDELIRDGDVVTERPRPRLMEYVADTVSGALERLVDAIFGIGSFDDTAATLVQWMIVALLAVLAAMLLVHWLRWWRRRETPKKTPRPDIVAVPAAVAAVDWRAELERRLESGDAAGALEALWWWLAGRLDQDDADASWTTRELARRAGRRDLMPLVRRWDRLVYAGGAPDVEGVRGLWHGLREALA